MICLLLANLPFQKQLKATGDSHLWLAKIKHHKKTPNGLAAGAWEVQGQAEKPGLVQLCRSVVEGTPAGGSHHIHVQEVDDNCYW